MFIIQVWLIDIKYQNIFFIHQTAKINKNILKSNPQAQLSLIKEPQQMDYQWHSLTNDKYKYQCGFFSENYFGKRFARLYHEFMLVAVASFGGPLAITSDKTQILTLREDDPTIQNIVVFNNQGEIMGRVKIAKPFENVVASLQFLQDQRLLAVFRRGYVWLIDPRDCSYKKIDVQGLIENEQLIDVKVLGNFMAARTSFRRFVFMSDVLKPFCRQFMAVYDEVGDTIQNISWNIFAPKTLMSEKIELHVAHPSAGIIMVIQDQEKKQFLSTDKSGGPCVKRIKYITNLSPNKKYVAYLSVDPVYKQTAMDQIPENLRKKQKGAPEPPRVPDSYKYVLVVCPALSSDSLQADKLRAIKLPFIKEGVHVKEDQAPLSIHWCGNKALVFQCQNQELYLCSVQGDFIRIENDRPEREKWSLIKEEIDGVRILTRKQNKILRQVPAAYASIFESFSEQPGALLYSAYEAFEDEAPLQDDHIRKDKNRLKAGVDQCLRAARFQLNFETISKLMRAATYGKAFLSPSALPNGIIYENSKLLRVVNHLREKMMRYITLQQVVALKDEQLLHILLRYRQHALAFQLWRYLRKDQAFRVRIFTDWACCKVNNEEQHQDDICEDIRFKLENEKGVSFTQIAHRSIQVGRSGLAMKLLEFEPSLSKKVPLLLWIGNRETPDSCVRFYEKGVQDALKSRDLNLLFLAIRKITQSHKIQENQMFTMFSRHPEGIFAVLNYYRLFDIMGLMRYYEFLQDSEKIIMEYIRMGISDKKYQNCQRLLLKAGQMLKESRGKDADWKKISFDKAFGHFMQFLKHNEKIKSKNEKAKPVTLSTQLNFFIQRGESDAVDDMMSQYKIPQKRAIMAKIKVLIAGGKYQDLLTFLERHQKKFKIPVELVADFVFKKKEVTWGMKILARMPDKQKDEQYMLLQRIGKVKEAIELAADRKDSEALEDIMDTLLDANLIALATEKLNNLRKK